jgi:putative ABC transport system permease protein
MVNRLLDRKLRRDLRKQLGPVIAIAVVITCGVASFVSERTMARILISAQAEYYARSRFPDLFAQVRRAPDAALPRLRAIRGVDRLEARVTGEVVLRVPGLREPATARIVGTREPGAGTLNHLVIREGRAPFPGERDAVVASEGFANANGIAVDDTLGAVIGDAWRQLRIVGIGTTAEFVYEFRPGDMLPDPEHYGVLWLDAEVAADALGYGGEWNDLGVMLTPGADTAAVVAALDAELTRYGSLGAYRRARHASHQFVDSEIRENETFAVVLPAIFLGVAAFLVNLVLGRVVTQQRDQVGMLKAYGFPTRTLVRHYALYALVPILPGVLLGTGLGLVFAAYLAGIYADFFRFPTLGLRFFPSEVVVSAMIAAVAALVGSLSALRRLLALPPAQAMLPEAPATYAHGFVDRALAVRLRSPVWRMIVRSLARQPVRTLLGALGIGLGAAVVVAGTFGFDAVARMRDVMFSLSLRADVTVVLTEARGRDALDAFATLPGVTRVEPVREVAVRIRHGHRDRTTALSGIESGAALRQIVDVDANVRSIAASGLTMGAVLARVLAAEIGDSVDVEFLDGRRRIVHLGVSAVVNDIAGLGAYVPAEDLPGLVGVGEFVTGADLAVQPDSIDALYDRLAEAPAVQSVQVRTATRDSFDRTITKSFMIVLVTLVLFAGALSAGTVYNSGRVTLSERARDLASLRVLGFTKGEVARMLFGELTVLGMIGIPVGLVIGIGFASAVVSSFGEGEIFRMPLVIGPRTLLAGVLVPVAAALLVALPLRRRLDRLDLIGVLKTRE